MALVIGRRCCLLASKEDVCNCSDVCEELKSVRLLGFVSWVCCPLLLSQGGRGSCTVHLNARKTHAVSIDLGDAAVYVVNGYCCL